MPYIEESIKQSLDRGIISPAVPGHLNYAFTTVILQYLEDRGLSYQTINDVVGALEACKLEFYRRVAVPYENEKIQANGDVYMEEQ